MSGPATGVPYDLAGPQQRDYFARFGDGLVVVLPAQRPGETGWGRGGPPSGGAWIHVGADGKVRAFSGKVEVGQGTRTALALHVAEELRVPLEAVEMIMGDTDLSPWDMGTFGSRSMPDAGEALRLTAASARTALRGLAAAQLGVPPESVELADGQARAAAPASGPPVRYGDLLRGVRRLETVDPSVRPLPASGWTVAGHAAVASDGRDVVTGARRYTSDLHPPGMLYGKRLFPPSFGATLRSVDLRAARALPGVTVVHEGEFVGVAAADLPTAVAALRALRADWELAPQPTEPEIVEYLRAHPTSAEDSWDVIHQESGAVDQALTAAPLRLRSLYTTAYIAHVPLEPHAVLAAWEGERLTVWMGAQTPFRAREALAAELHVPAASVRVIVPPTGSGFGGKHASDLAAGTARLARAAGRPVRITYTREEEFQHAYFRPMAVIEVRSGATQDGTLTAWQFHDLNAGASAVRHPYRVANQRLENQPSDSPLPQGPYRALSATANNFARESHLDEIAAAAGLDPVAYRLRLLEDERLAAVLRAVAERVAWTPRASPDPARSGLGRGVAVGLEKGGRVATFAEVHVGEDRRFELRRIVTGFECGAIVHPSNLRSQVEGATVMGLGGALFEAIHFDRGRILNPRLSEYRVPRFRDVPPIEVLLLDRKDLPSQGGGETPIIAVAPAIANAIFDATGRRLRSLPLVPEGVVP